MAGSDYARVEQAIRFLDEHWRDQPGLEEVAAEVGLSAFHFQRMFRHWAGVSPKRFLQFLSASEARRLLAESRSVLDTSLELGLSGPGRLHDLMISVDRMTPGEIKAGPLAIDWAIEDTMFGKAVFAATPRGLCGLWFLGDDGPRGAVAELGRRFPHASLRRAPGRMAPIAAELERRLRGRAPRPLSLLLAGTSFQLQVWEALLRVPAGRVVDYRRVATSIGRPGADRAVAQAIGANPIACLIPCHRVIQSTGGFGGYRWGQPRKRALLAVEQSRARPADQARSTRNA